MINNFEFGKNLKLLREKAKLTQADIANYLQISRQSVSKWESGNSLPSLIFLQPLCEILDCSIMELLKITEKR